MEANRQFDIGSLYYTCALVRNLNNLLVPWVTTWVYMGHVHTPGKSSKSCDVPEHFYYFIQYDPVMARMPRENWDSPGVYIPSLKHALRLKVTWEQLWSYELPGLVGRFADEQQMTCIEEDGEVNNPSERSSPADTLGNENEP